MATKRSNNDFSYDGNLSKVSFRQARYSEEPIKRWPKKEARERQSNVEDSLADIEENLSCVSEDY